MTDYLLGKELSAEIKKILPFERLTEVRLRSGKKTVVKDARFSYVSDFVASDNYIGNIVARATDYSLYAHQDELATGFLSYKNGIRIGVCGTVVTDGNKVLTIKNFTSLNIRIPHQITGIADELTELLTDYENCLVVAPPFGGKTTLIREITRRLSRGTDIAVVDERGELYGGGYFDLGRCTDIITGAQKHLISEGILRAMSPQTVVFDELFPTRDLECLKTLSRSGIKILAGIHAENADVIKKEIPELAALFTYAVTLSYKPSAGSIKSFERLWSD